MDMKGRRAEPGHRPDTTVNYRPARPCNLVESWASRRVDTALPRPPTAHRRRFTYRSEASSSPRAGAEAVHRQPEHLPPGASCQQVARAAVQPELRSAAQAVPPQDAGCLHHSPRADERKELRADGWLVRQQLHRQPSVGEEMRGAPDSRHQADGSTDAKHLLRRQSFEIQAEGVRSAKTERSPARPHRKRRDPPYRRPVPRARDADCG